MNRNVLTYNKVKLQVLRNKETAWLVTGSNKIYTRKQDALRWKKIGQELIPVELASEKEFFPDLKTLGWLAVVDNGGLIFCKTRKEARKWAKVSSKPNSGIVLRVY